MDTVHASSDFGKAARIQSFRNAQCSIRRNDGTEIVVGIPPYPLVLYKHVNKKQWEKAIRLCRFVKVFLVLQCLKSIENFCFSSS